MNIIIDRLQQRLEQLAETAKTPEGGVTRLSYTPEYLAGMAIVRRFMEEAGMTVRMDPLGNLIGRYEGMNTKLPPVVTGSHLDSVPNGGKFDGALGLISAIECVNAFHDTGWRPNRPVEVYALIEEEGTQFGFGVFGSRVLSGKLGTTDPAGILNFEGKSLAAMLNECGFDKNALASARLNPGDIHCFMELHVEQGEELYRTGIPCGLVTDIVGIYRGWVTLEGTANHSGTTRMDRRKDALAAAASVIQDVYQDASESANIYVATVGALDIWPGALNIVPGRVVMPVEIRAAHTEEIEVAKEKLQVAIEKAATRYGVAAHISKTFVLEPAHMDDRLVETLRQAASAEGVMYMEMPSWAGHDAQMIANVAPVAMVFVPSIDGISHSPGENTRWEDAELGSKVMLRALTKLSS